VVQIIGWRWIDDSLEIHWFKHEHGKFSFDLIKRVDLCKEKGDLALRSPFLVTGTLGMVPIFLVFLIQCV